MSFLKKLGVAILSTFVFSIALAILEYVPEHHQEPNVGYSSFSGLVILYFIYALPIYLIAGVLYSYLVDLTIGRVLFHSKFMKYVSYFSAYVVGGLFSIIILLGLTYLIDGHLDHVLFINLFILGIGASLIFYHVSLLLNKIKWNNYEKIIHS
ncbi:hypothetical protein [Oceanobacillus sp. CAU 1775]